MSSTSHARDRATDQRVTEVIGETKTMAFRKALRDPLERLRRERFVWTLAAELNAIGLHCARQPVLDNRSADEILGYDETGRPAPR